MRTHKSDERQRATQGPEWEWDSGKAFKSLIRHARHVEAQCIADLERRQAKLERAKRHYAELRAESESLLTELGKYRSA